MRNLILSLFILFSHVASAQLADGSFAPDFTLQDLNGNTWHLHELLEQGKNVVVNFSATWCPPCWSLHESGLLDEIYDSYGPNGTDEFMVFMIEIDPQTSLDCLVDPGCPGNSGGDWTEGTLYPIINDDFIGTNYHIQYIPTLYHICPNKLITEVYGLDAASIYALKDDCAVITGKNNAYAKKFLGYSGNFCGSIKMRPYVQIQNLGQLPITNLIAECYVNDVLQQTISWTGDVVSFATFPVSFDSILVSDETSIDIRIVSINGVPDDDTSNNHIVSQLTQIAPQQQNQLRLELTTGTFPHEIYWELTNSDSAVLYRGGNGALFGKEEDGGTYQENNTTYTIPIMLPGDGCYTFTIHDYIGNGYGVRSYKIVDSNGSVIAEDDSLESSGHHLIRIENAADPIFHNGAITGVDSLDGAICSKVSFSPYIQLLNQGLDIMTHAEIELLESGVLLEEITWTGNASPGEEAIIPVPSVYFASGEDVLFRIKSINGEADVYPYKNEWQTELTRHLSKDHELKFYMKLGAFAYAIYWQLTNDIGEVLYSGGNTLVGPDGGGSFEAQPNDPGAYSSEETVYLDMVLPDSINACYEFLVVDAFGDGNYGSYTRFTESHSGKIVMIKEYGLPYETFETWLEVDPLETSLKPISELKDIILYPNPAQSELQVMFDAERSLPLSMSIINLLGEKFPVLPETTYAEGSGNITLDISALQPGLYFLQLNGDDQQQTKKFIVNR